MPRLSIIIVTYNSRAELEVCLRSLTDTPVGIDREIVVVDNASTDGTPEYLRERWPGVRLIQSDQNTGFARANNTGLRQTFGDLILFLNPDTSVPGGTIETLVSALEADPMTAVAGPRVVDGSGHAELSFGRMISPLAELRQKILVKGSSGGTPVLRPLVERMTRQTRAVDWVSGACLLARRTDVEAVGGFDERYFLYNEDVDLCASIRARGRRILFVAEAEVTHLRGRSGASAPAATAAAYRRSQIAFYQKHHPRWVPALRLYHRMSGRR